MTLYVPSPVLPWTIDSLVITIDNNDYKIDGSGPPPPSGILKNIQFDVESGFWYWS